MKSSDIRGYVVALSLLGFSGAWAAAAHDATPTTTTDPTADALLRKQAAMLTAREKQLAARTRQVRKIIAARRALAKKPRPVRYVRVYAGGGGGGYTPAPVTITPVASSGSS